MSPTMNTETPFGVITFRRRSVSSLKRQTIDSIRLICSKVFVSLPRRLAFEGRTSEGLLESKIQKAVGCLQDHLLLGIPASLAEELVPIILSSIEAAARRFVISPCDHQTELNDSLYVTLRMTEIVALDFIKHLNLKVVISEIPILSAR